MPHWIDYWPLNTAASVALAIALAAVVIGSYSVQFRRTTASKRPGAVSRSSISAIVMLRLLALTVLMWMLAGTAYQDYQARPAAIWVCIDRSASMLATDGHETSSLLQADDLQSDDTQAERRQQQTRFETAATAVDRLVAAYRDRHAAAFSAANADVDVRYFLLGESAVEVNRRQLVELVSAAARFRQTDIAADGTIPDDRERLWQMLKPNVEQPQSITDVSAAAGFASRSPLGDSLSSLQPLLAIERPAAVVLISDGNVTDGTPLEAVDIGRSVAEGSSVVSPQSVSAAAVPIFGLTAGMDAQAKELEIAGVAQPSIVFAGDQVALSVRLEAQNLLGRRVRVELHGEIEGVALATQTVSIDTESWTGEVMLEAIAPQDPRWPLQVVAELEQPDSRRSDLADHNDRLRTFERLDVHVRTTPIRVLLIAETYGYETRFLKQLFERTRQRGNPQAAVFEPTFCIAAAQQPLVQTDPQLISFLPIEEDWWSQFEICICIDPPGDRFDPALADAIEHAARRQGCGLIFIAGKLNRCSSIAGRPWRSLLPVETTVAASAGFGDLPMAQYATTEGAAPVVRWRWTDAAAIQPAWRSTLASFEGTGGEAIPLLWWHCEAVRPKPAAVVLATAQSLAASTRNQAVPLLATHIVGFGRVAYVGSDELYRWRTYLGNERLYLQFFSDLIASVIKRPEAASKAMIHIELAAEQYDLGEPVSIDARIDGTEAMLAAFGDTLSMQLVSHSTAEGDASAPGELRLERITAGRYTATVQGLSAGDYVLRPGDWKNIGELVGRDRFRVELPPGEWTAIEPRPEAMESLASRGGGRSTVLSRWREVAETLPPPHALQFEPLPPKSVWNSPWVAGLIVAALSAEWYLRNRWGLI